MAHRALLAALSALLLVIPATPAAPEPAPLSRLNWVFDGAVQSAARVGDVLYVGGLFRAVAPAANALPPLYALSQTTGAVTGPGFPAIDGPVSVIEPDGAGGYFVGGEFTALAGVAQAYLAHLLADGTFDPVFRPVVDGPVVHLARIGGSLFLAGSFWDVGGTPVLGVAAVTTNTGARTTWQRADLAIGTVSGLMAADDRLVVSGSDALPMAASGLVGAYDAATGASLWVTSVAPGGVQQPRGSAGAMVRDGTRVYVAHSVAPSNPGRGLSRLSLSTGAVDAGWNPNVAASVLALSGTTLYVAGSFSSAGGAARQNLAAFDITTGALLPWNPGSISPVFQVVPSGAGGVFVGGLFETIAGQARRNLAEIDASGAVTPWVADVRPDTVRAIAAGPSGTLLVSSGLTSFGHVARNRLAAFDLSTGDLLLWAPAANDGVSVIGATGARVTVSGRFTAINGVAADSGAALDPVTGALLPWSPTLPGGATFVDDTWMYWAAGPSPSGPYVLERYSLASGARDESWRLPASASGVADGDTLYLASSGGLAAVDRRTARVLWFNAGANVRRVAVSGDTVYTDGGLFGLTTHDARTGALMTSQFSGSGASALTVADGRLFVNGSDPNVPGSRGLVALTLDGRSTAWQPGVAPSLITDARAGFLPSSDALVAFGSFGRYLAPALQGLAVYPLDGARAPSALRARPRGAAIEFTWTPPASAPPGGYVLEAGTSPGTTAVVVPIGTTPTYTTVVPPGTYYVRIRASASPAASGEVSNEVRVVGGCLVPPSAPSALTATIVGRTVTLTWQAPDAFVTSYTLSAGSAAGRADLARVTMAGEATSLTATDVPPATYYVRLVAANSCGASGSSADVFFTVGAAEALPAAPRGLAVETSAAGRTLVWTPPPGPVTGYVLEAGGDIGAANLVTVTLGPTPSFVVPPVVPGTYVVRVRAVNAAGVGPPSSDVVLRVP
ncbi:MAG: fibronectin type III domain-containing protein [Acidobacteria bacterium]|nr:fibronectin type III domain-containing protein [Acidobacteriota bacterium]